MDWILAMPWPNRRRPFIGLHVAYPSYRTCNGKTTKLYHCGIIWGRQFMPGNHKSRSIWFDVPIPDFAKEAAK